jgi:uncharacterized protein YuzE
MRWSYDLSANALYIYLTDEGVVGQVEMPDGVIVDVDKDGHAVGIEVLSPDAGWDVAAVVQRFQFDQETINAIGGLLMSPLLRQSPAPRRQPATALQLPERPVEATSNDRPPVLAG